MTSKETIKEFEYLLKVEKDRVHKDVVFITALENAIEALEKQIPKKPQTATYFYGFKYSCPACSKTLCFDFDEQKEYCPECGQALDWSSENE